jgi:membrane protease YdiL (CAAX protease family)
VGVAVDALIFLGLLWRGALGGPAEQRLYWSLALVPLLRVFSLSLPIAGLPPFWWYPCIGAPLVLAVALTARAVGYGAADLGLRWRWRQLPLHLLVGLIGVPLGAVEYLILFPAPLVPALEWRAAWLPAVVLLISTGFAEELLFRGLMQRAWSAVYGPVVGPLLVTTMFASLHLGHASWPNLALMFFVGALFALVAARTGSIWGVSLAHGLTNVVLFLVAPFTLGPAAL